MISNYIVQNPHMTQSAARGVVQGREILVTVDVFEVELVSADGMQGTIKRRFFGDEIAPARELFIADALITSDLRAAAAPAEAKAA